MIVINDNPNRPTTSKLFDNLEPLSTYQVNISVSNYKGDSGHSLFVFETSAGLYMC